MIQEVKSHKETCQFSPPIFLIWCWLNIYLGPSGGGSTAENQSAIKTPHGPGEEGKSSVLVVGHREFLFSLKFSLGFFWRSWVLIVKES